MELPPLHGGGWVRVYDYVCPSPTLFRYLRQRRSLRALVVLVTK